MADLTFEVAMRDDATPVLRNIKVVADQSLTAVQRAAQVAGGAFEALAKSEDAASKAAERSQSSFDKARKSMESKEQVSRKLKNGLEQVFQEMGLTAIAANELADAVFKGADALTKTTAASIGAGFAINAVITSLRAASEEKRRFNEAFQKNDISFFTSEIDRMNEIIASSGNLSERLSGQIIRGLLGDTDRLALTFGTLQGKVDAYNEALGSIRSNKLADVTRELERQKTVLQAGTPIGRIAAEGRVEVEKAATELAKLGLKGPELARTIVPALRQITQLKIGEAVRDYVRAIEDSINATRQQTIEFERGADAADAEALRLANLKAAQEGVGKAAADANERLIVAQRNLKDAQVVKSLSDQRDALAAQRKELLDGAAAADDFRFSIMAANAQLQTSARNLADVKNALEAYRNEQLALRAAQFGEQVKTLERQITGEIFSEVTQRIEAAKREYAERIKLLVQWKDFAEQNGKDVTEQFNRLVQASAESLTDKVDFDAQLRKKFQAIAIQEEILGPDFDSIGPKIQAVTDTLTQMIQRRQDLEQMASRGFLVDPAELERIGEQIDMLKEKLQELREIQRLEQAIDGMVDGIVGALDRFQTSAGNIFDRLKALANDVLGSINREVTKLLVTDPIKDWLKEQLKVVFPKIGLPVPGQTPGIPGGGAPGVPDPAAVAAIQSTQATAVTAIEAQSATAQAGLQAEQIAGEVSIQATQSVAIVAIESVQATAIAAIEAAAAAAASSGGGGDSPMSSIPFVGSLFGGASGGATGGMGGDMFAGGATGFEAGFFHRGGRVGDPNVPRAWVPAALFRNADRYHGGGPVLEPGEVPMIGRRGERVLTEDQYRQITTSRTSERPVNVNFKIPPGKTAESWRRSQRSILRDTVRLMQSTRRAR